MYAEGWRLLRRGNYISGAFEHPDEIDGWVVGFNPGDRADAMGRFAFSAASVDHAVAAARTASSGWRSTPLDERLAWVTHVADLLEAESEGLSCLLTRETGKPHWEAAEEVAGAIRACRLLSDEAPGHLSSVRVREGTAWSDARPHGIVGVVTPWTFPLLTPTLHVMSALVTGNTVVFKPSKFAPGSGQALAELIDRARLPRGVFNLVQGSGGVVGKRLVAHPDLNALLFTGSHETAAVIRRVTATRPELTTWFQTGGKGVGLVLPDADLERAVYDITVSAFVTAGQRHNSTQRVFVPASSMAQVQQALVDRARQLTIGYGFDEGVFYGPLISDAHRARYLSDLEVWEAAGHGIALRGEAIRVEGHRGYYVTPSVLVLNGQPERVPQLTGPVVVLESYDTLEQAIARHEGLDYRLATSLFTSDPEAALREVAPHLTTGCLNLNRGTIGSSLRLPGVGAGRASSGVPSDIHLLKLLTRHRAVLVDRRPTDAARYVPGSGPELSG